MVFYCKEMFQGNEASHKVICVQKMSIAVSCSIVIFVMGYAGIEVSL
jgi:hypothetical protein